MRRGLLLSLILCWTASPALAADPPGRVGPSLGITANGRALHPIGEMTTLGNFPTAAAFVPGTPFLWSVDSGHGKDDVQVIDTRSGRIVQTLPLAGAFGGIAFAPDGSKAYVSGSPAADEDRDGKLPGGDGDVVHVFAVDTAHGTGTATTPIALPSASGGSGQTNSVPPVSKLYPSGMAVSPDGATLAVVLSQADRVALVPTAGGTVREVRVGRYPNSVVFDRGGRAWVSNALDGTLSVLADGTAAGTVSVGSFNSQPEGMVLDPKDDRLYVAVTQRDEVAVVDTARRAIVTHVSVGRSEGTGVQPTALAVDPDGQTLYVADSGEDTLAAIALRDRPTSTSDARRATRYRPPSVERLRGYALAVARETRRYLRERRAAKGRTATRRATRAHARRVSAIHARLLKTARVRACSGPTKAQARLYRQRVLRALRGRKAKRAAALRAALRRLPTIAACASDGAITGLKAYDVVGKLPTAAYPTAVQVGEGGSDLVYVAGKGLGTGPNPEFVFEGSKSAFGKVKTPYGQYVLDKLLGRLGRLALPTDRQVRAMTRAAQAQAVPANAASAPAGTPVRAGGPIKHVFYVVRENRTYDQIFGSDPRGDGDARLELFDDNGVAGPTGGITPNAHKLARTFPLLDHLYADSEVSVDGHVITAGSIANDYVQKSTAQNYSRPGRSFDFGVFPITFGPNGFVFDQAVRQGLSFRNYGEVGAGTLPFGAEGRSSTYPQVQANTDVSYPTNVQIGCLAPGGQVGNLAACSQDSGVAGPGGSLSSVDSRFNNFAAQFTAQVAAGTVPAFNYLVLPNDHTNGTTPNTYTPQALIADNDLGLGQMVDLISHSSIWDSSAIFVVEDDSQDGADHVDAHRMPAFAISPWAKRGAVVSTRYDQYSVLRTAELMLGLKPLSINDALATPMYDAFDTAADVEGTRYSAVRPEQSLTAVNTAASPMAALSRALPFEQLDVVPQAVLDRILWASVHGEDSSAPQPGPGASEDEHARAVGALRALAAGRDARAWLAAHTEEDGDDAQERDSEGDDVHPIRVPRAVQATADAEARRMLGELRAGGR